MNMVFCLRTYVIIYLLGNVQAYHFNNIFKSTFNKYEKWTPINLDEEYGYKEYMKSVEKENYYCEKLKIGKYHDSINEMIRASAEQIKFIEPMCMIQDGEVPIID